jgi:hypothetical protein
MYSTAVAGCCCELLLLLCRLVPGRLQLLVLPSLVQPHSDLGLCVALLASWPCLWSYGTCVVTALLVVLPLVRLCAAAGL